MAKTSQVKEITEKLEQGVKDLWNSKSYANYLKTMSRFHKYSTRNTILIHMQRPDASYVAGFRSWQTKFGRNVKKGEKAIRILAPVPFVMREEKEKLDPQTHLPVLGDDGTPIVEYTERQLARFKVANVFDVKQTDGKPLPTLVQDLTGNVEQYEAFMDALKAVSPLPIVVEQMPENIDGACYYGDRIAIREGMSEIQTVSAAIHEITHAKLHDLESLRLMDETATPKDRNTQEVEAESVSYAVCQYFNIETGDNSFGYVMEWSKNRELKELNTSLDTIRKAASELIDDIDGKFQELVKERNVTLAVGEAQMSLEEPPAEIHDNDEQKQHHPVEITVDKKTMENKLYDMFAELFPQFANGEYSYLRLEAGDGMMPLSLEYIFGDRISVMHTYKHNGDLCYDPMMEFRFDNTGKTMSASVFEQSIPPIYQYFDEDGIGVGVDGSGNQYTVTNLQAQLDDFASIWLNNLSLQGYIPVRGIKEIDGVDVQVLFDDEGQAILPETETPKVKMEDALLTTNDIASAESDIVSTDNPTHGNITKEYSLGYGFLGNGITVWNRADMHNGDYATIAHINHDRTVKFYDEAMPDAVKGDIKNVARTMVDDALIPLPVTNIQEPPKTTELDLSLPDPTVTTADINSFGYTYNEMLPLSNLRAVELFDTNHPIYLLYPDDTESFAIDRDEIRLHEGYCGIEREDWERSPIRAAQMAAIMNNEGSRESELIHGEKSMFGIYQIPDGIDETRNIRFMPMHEIEALGLEINRNNYKLVYTAPLTTEGTQASLNQIFFDFNSDERPADYYGRSLSVSDIIVLQQDGEISSHYVDSIGFEELLFFVGEEREKAPAIHAVAQDKEPDNESDAYSQVGNSTGMNTGPTVAELEADVNDGKSISLFDLSKAIKAEQSASKPGKPAPKSKPTLMARLEDGKRKAAQNGQLQPSTKKEERG